MSGFLETVGWLTVAVIAIKSVYNTCHFVFSVYLGAFLGYQLDVSQFGPWAGSIQILVQPTADDQFLINIQCLLCTFIVSQW